MNKWINLTYLRNSHWGQGPKSPLGTWWKHWEHSQHVTPMCPEIKCWVHFECAQPSDSNVPSGQTIGHIFNVRRNLITMCPVGKMLNIFKICLAEKVQCNQRPSIDRIYNVPCHVTLLYPNKGSGYIQSNVLNTAENNNIQNVPYKMATFGANSGYIVNVLTEFAQVTFLGKFWM